MDYNDFEQFLKKCIPYKYNNTMVYFYGEYSNQDFFSDSQWNKLCVKKDKKNKTGIYYKHRIFYRNMFNESQNGKILTIIMFNPSTANHYSNDPTINNCIRIAKDNNYDGIEVINILTIRNPDINLAINESESSILQYTSYLDYLNNKDVLIAWGGNSTLNEKNKSTKRNLQNKFLTELAKRNIKLYTYSTELVNDYFPRHPSPKSFNMALKNHKVELVNNKIKLKKITYENKNIKIS